MNPFQTISLVIAVVLLILILAYLGIKMSSYGTNNTIIEFPVKHNICPDRWGYNGTDCIAPQMADPNYKLLKQSDFPLGSTTYCNDTEITDISQCTGSYSTYNWSPTDSSVPDVGTCSDNTITDASKCAGTYDNAVEDGGVLRRVDYSSFNPMSEDWTNSGKTAICAKREWANNAGILWDGVSNYTKC
jgi:hypothetical protein